MDRWVGKVAVVTGASAGIGAAIAKALVEAGMKVVGLDLNKEKMEKHACLMNFDNGGKFFAIECDLTKENLILEAFDWVKRNLGGVDVQLNNAGIMCKTMLTNPDNTDDLRRSLEVNVLGLCFCTREAFISMKQRNVAGYIIHINSFIGHCVPYMKGRSLNIYPGTKHCVTSLAEVLRQEMMKMGNRTKITSISPGLVATEIIGRTSTPEQRQEFLSKTPHLLPEDVSQAVLYCLGTPDYVQVHELTIRAVGEKI